jgi:hypothetical protein
MSTFGRRIAAAMLMCGTAQRLGAAMVPLIEFIATHNEG